MGWAATRACCRRRDLLHAPRKRGSGGRWSKGGPGTSSRVCEGPRSHPLGRHPRCASPRVNPAPLAAPWPSPPGRSPTRCLTTSRCTAQRRCPRRRSSTSAAPRPPAPAPPSGPTAAARGRARPQPWRPAAPHGPPHTPTGLPARGPQLDTLRPPSPSWLSRLSPRAPARPPLGSTVAPQPVQPAACACARAQCYAMPPRSGWARGGAAVHANSKGRGVAAGGLQPSGASGGPRQDGTGS